MQPTKSEFYNLNQSWPNLEWPGQVLILGPWAPEARDQTTRPAIPPFLHFHYSMWFGYVVQHESFVKNNTSMESAQLDFQNYAIWTKQRNLIPRGTVTCCNAMWERPGYLLWYLSRILTQTQVFLIALSHAHFLFLRSWMSNRYIDIKTLPQERYRYMSWRKFNFKRVSCLWHRILLVIWKRSAWAFYR